MSENREALPRQSVGRWQRTVTTHTWSRRHGSMASARQVEYLDVDAAVERLYEAMQERPDASVRDWLDCALNGWGDES